MRVPHGVAFLAASIPLMKEKAPLLRHGSFFVVGVSLGSGTV